jgi:hypothetical protein
MLNLQSNTQQGPRVFATASSLSGLEGLLVKLVNASGVAQVALPGGIADVCPYLVHDGGFAASGSVGGPSAAVWPLAPDRNFRVALKGACNPGDTLCLADPAANGGADAGKVRALPALGSGLTLGSVTLSSNKITAVAVSAGGTGYTQGQAVTFADSAGYGAAAHLNVNGSGAVTSVAVDDGGAGYSSPVPVVANPGVTYAVIGVAEEAGVDGQLVLLRPFHRFAVV